MPRQPNIKWRKQDIDLLRSTVKNFNAKINRILKKHPEMATALPKKLSVKELRKDITTRTEFNREIKSYQRFSQKGAEKLVKNKYGVIATSWEVKRTGMLQGIINKRRKKRLEQIPKEKRTGRIIKELNLNKDTQSFYNRKQFAWDKFRENVERQARFKRQAEKDERYHKNYGIALDREMPTTAKIIRSLVAQMPPYHFGALYSEEVDLQIDFVYGALEEYYKAGRIVDAFAKYGIYVPDSIRDEDPIWPLIAVQSNYYSEDVKQNQPWTEIWVPPDPDDIDDY